MHFRSGTELCAVASLDDLLDWFGKGDCLTYLKQANCIMRVYNVPVEDCKVGRHQVVFFPDNKELAEEIEL